jgi:M6 family metalloprotease-like protein
MRLPIRLAVPLGLLTLFSMPTTLLGQDVELLGRIHGTRPPQGYYDLLERDPGAFQFRRALIRRGLGLEELPTAPPGTKLTPAVYHRLIAEMLAEGPRQSPVIGTFKFPLILGLFDDSPAEEPAYGRSDVQAEFFDGPQVNPQAVGTIPEFYTEISGGRVTLAGVTFDWVETPLTRAQVTAGSSGLGWDSRVGEYIIRILQSIDDGSIDFGQFDNDGPDGIPNSGDDDGFVDVLAVMHPTPGAECQNVSERPNRIWSHRWTLFDHAEVSGASWTPSLRNAILADSAYVTKSVSANPDRPWILVDDYTIQPVRDCSGNSINYIGVFAHELGHGFGLPDLYATNTLTHPGIGDWGLMGTGSWGCDGDSPWRPCHLSAWSKAVLGWGEIEVLETGTDLGTLTLPPVETSGRVFRFNSGDGSSEYLLLENRQKLGFDQNLYEPGLLIWHIDPTVVWTSPASLSEGINNDPERLGVWLRQADGLNTLAEQGAQRGDDGDPFPGSNGNTVFHAGSNPSSWTHGDNPMGITLLDIQQAGENLTFRALTRYQTLTLNSETVLGTPGLVAVDGVAGTSTAWTMESAPFETHLIEAAPGEPISTGRRWGFQGWMDGAPRIRQHTTQLEDATFTATYGGQEFFIDVTLSSDAPGVVPGSVEYSAGDGAGWVPQGEAVTVTVTPRTGFQFREWVGDFAGLPNPASITATGPMDSDAVFDVTFSVDGNPTTVDFDGGIQQSVSVLVENANLPVTWSMLAGELPPYLNLDQSGSIWGTPIVGGEFPLTLRVIDDIGLQGFLPLTLIVDDPELPVASLASDFLLTGPPLSASAKIYLDNEGNENGSFDLGDIRAYVLRNPNVDSFTTLQTTVEKVISVGDLKRSPPGGEVKREESP